MSLCCEVIPSFVIFVGLPLHVRACRRQTVPKGAWPGSRDQLSNFAPHEISSERLKLQTSNSVHALATRSANFQMTNCPLSGRDQGHVMHSTISHPQKHIWNT